MTQHPPNKDEQELDSLIQELGDICHTHYLGCTGNKSAPDGYEYSYDNEVINLLGTPEARKVITRHTLAVLEEVERELEDLTHYDRSLFRDGYTDDPADRRDMFVKEHVITALTAIKRRYDEQ